jgi:hypothetical protein
MVLVSKTGGVSEQDWRKNSPRFQHCREGGVNICRPGGQVTTIRLKVSLSSPEDLENICPIAICLHVAARVRNRVRHLHKQAVGQKNGGQSGTINEAIGVICCQVFHARYCIREFAKEWAGNTAHQNIANNRGAFIDNSEVAFEKLNIIEV